MTEVEATNTCLACNAKFSPWEDCVECQNCDDGDQEVDNEFGEGSYYRRCRHCGGKGVITYTQERFCSEECGEIHDEEQ